MVFPQPWIRVGKSHCTSSLSRHHKTKFSTVYQIIYLPKWKFWIQLSSNYILIAYKSSHEKTGFLHNENKWIQCISNVNTIGIFLQWKIWYFFTSDWYDLYFHRSKTMIFWDFGNGTEHFSKNFTRRMFVRNYACCDVNIKDNDVTVWPGVPVCKWRLC